MIEVRTYARLHLGLLDNNGGLGRLYGSIGVAVNRPHLVLTAEKAEALEVEGSDAERVATFAKRFIQRYGLPAGARLRLTACIPPHVGLGSGTQTALAVGAALARLAGLRLSAGEIALAVGRGIHSGIGISTFLHGGFVLDGGHRLSAITPEAAAVSGPAGQTASDSVPPVLFRHPLPKDWSFVTVIPKTDRRISGESEARAFLELPRAPAPMVERISWLLLMKMLPAVVEQDIENFGRALTEIQRIVGDCFASIQGGRYASPASEKLVDFMLDRGAAGVGQSSWGPTVYGLIKGRERARRLVHEVKAYLTDLGGGDAFYTKPRNCGARLREI
jgi:beta-RFAP synthase